MQKVIIIKIPATLKSGEIPSVIDIKELNDAFTDGFKVVEIHQLNAGNHSIITFIIYKD